MAWKGEEDFKKYFGLRGFKCLVKLIVDEINIVRSEAGLPARTLSQFVTKMNTLMNTYKADDEGPDPV